MHEVVTLQFGQQANYVGTHYWNTQEAYFTYDGQEDSPVDHDISFRAGTAAGGSDTYTPRTLIYDLKGAFGTLRRENALYASQHPGPAAQQDGWSGVTVPLQLPPIPPSSYQQALDQGTEPPRLTTETVRFWSDYNHLFYHPRSIVQLNEYEVNSSLMPFQRYSTGEDLFADLDREHDLLDRDLRPFLEECDQLQGFQVFTGIDDAWGGFASRYLERIADEMGKCCTWVFGLQEGRRSTRDLRILQVVNAAQSYHALNTSASIHIPLTSSPSVLPPYVALDVSSRWHTSAVQSTIVESATLPTRLRTSESARDTFGGLETTLSSEGSRRVAAATLTVDDSPRVGDDVDRHYDSRMTNGHANSFPEDEWSKADMSFFTDATVDLTSTGRPNTRRAHTFSQVISLRGNWMAQNEIAESNAEARDRFSGGPRTVRYQSGLLFPVLSSYPLVFRFDSNPRKLAVKTALSMSTLIAERIRGLEGIARRYVDLNDREALCDGLATMAEEYEDGWSENEESGDE